MRLLILSRNALLYSTSRLVLSARARGHEVRVIDPLEFQVVVSKGKPLLYVGAQRMDDYDLVIPRIGASITNYGLAVVRQFERSGVAVLNNAESIAQGRDKLRALQRLLEMDLPVPRTVCARTPGGVDSAVSLLGGFPVIVKMLQGTQGIGTMIADTPQALHALLETLWALGQDILLQEYVSESGGRDLRAIVVGTKIVAAMRRVAKPGEFRSNLHRGGKGDVVRLSARAQQVAIKAASAMGLAVAGVDMLEGRVPKILEVNSSPGLEGIERATNVDVAGAIISYGERMIRRPRSGSKS